MIRRSIGKVAERISQHHLGSPGAVRAFQYFTLLAQYNHTPSRALLRQALRIDCRSRWCRRCRAERGARVPVWGSRSNISILIIYFTELNIYDGFTSVFQLSWSKVRNLTDILQKYLPDVIQCVVVNTNKYTFNQYLHIPNL